MGYRVTKRLGGYPCSHRQWKDDGHCRWMHGYDRWVDITWEGERDERGWVIDFGALGSLKDLLEHQFDHTCLIDPEDPTLELWQTLAEHDAVDLRLMDPTMEGMAAWVQRHAASWTRENIPTAGRRGPVQVVEVSCWENEKNCATWTTEDKWLR